MSDRTSNEDEETDPRRELLELGDTSPHDALSWIGRLDPELARDPIIQMAKILSYRRIALGAPGQKTGTDFRQKFSETELAALQDALDAIRTLQESDPHYFQEQTETYDPGHPISSVLITAEGVWPGSVQSNLGWTRFNYFHGKQLGYAPHVAADKVPGSVRAAIYACKLRDLPLFKSAFVIGFAPALQRLSIWLLEEDFRYTGNVGAAGNLGTLTISSDGSYEFRPQGEALEQTDAQQDPEPLSDGTTAVPWAGIAIAFVFVLIVVSCIRQMH
jgi:hypothetical protein